MKHICEAVITFAIAMLILILFVDAMVQFFFLFRAWNGFADLMIMATVILTVVALWKAPKT